MVRLQDRVNQKNPKRWQDFRKEYEDKNKALDAQRDLEIKQKFPKYYRLGQQLDDARAEKYTYLDMDYIDEGHPLWPKYEKAYDKVRDLEVKYWNAEDKYGPQGLTAIKDKYQKLKDENHQAYLKGVDTFNGLGEAKSIGAMLGGLGLIGVGGKLLSKTAADSDFLQKRKTPLTLAGMAGLAAGVHEATKPLDMIASRRSLIKDYAPQVANAKTRAKDSIAWLRKNGVDNPNAWMYKDELKWARNDLRMSRPFLRRYKDDLKYLLKRRNIGLGVAALGAGAILGANALSKSAAAEKKYEELSNTQMGLPVGSGIGTAFAARNHYVNKAKTFTKDLANVEDQLQFQTAWNQKSRNASSLGRALSKLEHSSLNKEKALLESKLLKASQNQRKIPKRILGATAAAAAGMGLYNAVQRAKQKGYEQRQAWYAKRKEKTASKQTDARKQALTYSLAGMGAAVYGMNALAKARQTLEAARLREKLVNTKIVGDAAVEAARTGIPSNPVVYAKDGTLAVQSAKQALAKHRKRNLAITAAGLGLLAYGNHINPDNQVYVKTSAEEPKKKRPASWHNYVTKGVRAVIPHNIAEAAIPLAGAAIGAGSFVAQSKVLNPARKKLMQDRNALNFDTFKAYANYASRGHDERVANLNARIKQYETNVKRYNKLQKLVNWGPTIGSAVAIAGLPAYHHYQKKQQEK